jgi:aspartyl-tRNA(Asn)/glutamyl-tRNA(Gln) amidotransferase subunit A
VSRDLIREMVAAVSRLRGLPTGEDRVEEWAARLEAHLTEVELLAGQAIPDPIEPAFQPTPVRPHAVGATGANREAGQTAARAAPRHAERKGHAASGSAVDEVGALNAAPFMARGHADPPTLTVAVRLLRTRQMSATDLFDQCLNRIRESRDLNVFIAIFEEQAQREAQAADRSLVPETAGLLAGIPLAVKDLMQMRGYAMTGGSRALDPTPASEDAEVVSRLRRAGGVILGAANLHELAYGVTSENPHFGAVKNPRKPSHMAGGSSGGSAAAVAARLALGAVGTDTGGSIRIPAAACGIVGLKPTHGRVSRRGVLPLSWSLDHVGPLGATCADAAVMLAAMADHPTDEERALARALTAERGPSKDERTLSPGSLAAAALARALDREATDSGERPGGDLRASRVPADQVRETVAGLRLGAPSAEWLETLHDGVSGVWHQTLARLEEIGVPVSIVEPPPMPVIRAAQFVILHTEAATFHRERLRSRSALLGSDVRLRLQLGEMLMAVDYVQGQRLRRWIAEGFQDLLKGIDALVLPALPVSVPPLGARMVTEAHHPEPVQRALTRYTIPFNQTGLPALVVPAGLDATGLPVALQVAGGPHRELDILRVGIALEALIRLS